MIAETALLQDPDFWKNAWKKNRNASFYVKKKIRSEFETIEFWNEIAPTYGKNAIDRSNERVRKVIDYLEQRRILSQKSRILDVGCGPGTYAIPFASRTLQVTAIDSAQEMLLLLEKKAAAKMLTNVRTLHKMWKDVDLEKENFEKQFDFVFASMTPAVCDYSSLLKLIRASKKYCCLITSVGGGYGVSRHEIWEALFEEKQPEHPTGFIFIFNLLFSLGYQPAVHYLNSAWVKEETEQESIERLLRSLWLYTDITDEIKEAVTAYVKSRSEDGIFKERRNSCLAVMIWDVASAS